MTGGTRVRQPLRFGDFELRPDERCLLQCGRPVRLGARAFDVLLALLDRRGRLVTKHELLDTVWPGLVVEEANVQVQVSALRKVIGPQAVATLPGLGYRLAVMLDDAAPLPAPAAALDPHPGTGTAGRIPLALGPLIGRAQAVAEVHALLDDHRLITIAGPGGVGKTRLAQALAAGRSEHHTDGVRWLDLAPLSEPDAVLPALAKAVGSGLDSAGSEISLQRALGGRRLLLVVDNAEHLLHAVAPLLARLLAAAAGLHVLVTSRSVLQLAGEHVFPLQALPLPAATVPFEQARQFGALQLLEQRAQAADRRFALNAANLRHALAVCQRLDGLPLAIEMAAARLPLLGLSGVLDQLDADMGSLHAPVRDAPLRQRSLRHLLEWSHRLLRPDEALLFRRLSVFAGSFRIDTAQQAAAGADLDRWALVEALAGLVDQSLVKLERIEPPRYRLLDTTRAFARERLIDAGEADLIALAHARAMARLATQVLDCHQPSANSADPTWNIDDYEDLALAFEEARAAADADTAAEVLQALRAIDQLCGLMSASERRVLPAAALLDHASARGQARLLTFIASCGNAEVPGLSRVEAAKRAAGLWCALGDRFGQHGALCLLATESARASLFDAARATLKAAADIENPAWPPRARAGRWIHDGWVALFSGDLARSRDSFRRAIAMCGEGSDRAWSRTARNWLAWTTLAADDLAEAVVLSQSLVDEDVPGRHDEFAVFARMVLAQSLLRMGDPARARAVLGGLPAVTDIADPAGLGLEATVALLAAASGQLHAAAQLLGHAEAAGAAGDRIEARLRADTRALLEGGLPPERWQALCDEGASMPGAQVMQLMQQVIASSPVT